MDTKSHDTVALIFQEYDGRLTALITGKDSYLSRQQNLKLKNPRGLIVHMPRP